MIHNVIIMIVHQLNNSYSASAPLNGTKIAVKKVTDVEVVRFGPELD